MWENKFCWQNLSWVLSDICFRHTTCLRLAYLKMNIRAATWQNQQNDCAPSEDRSAWAFAQSSEDSHQPGHSPSLIRVFAVRMKKAWVLSYPMSAYRRLWSDWADAQADLSLCWVHRPFCWFCHEAAQMTTKILIIQVSVDFLRVVQYYNMVIGRKQ